MRHVMGALLAGSAMLAGGAARGQTTSIVDKVTITGNTSVPTDKLMAAVQEHKGSRVTKDDIVADRDAIMKVLEQSNVGGNVGARIATLSNRHLAVEFVVQDQGIQKPIVTKVAPKLHAQIIDGNKSIPTDKLIAATGLSAGDDLTNAKVVAAETAIENAYKAAKLPIDIALTGETHPLPGGQVDVLWHVVETKGTGKKESKHKDADDQLN